MASHSLAKCLSITAPLLIIGLLGFTYFAAVYLKHVDYSASVSDIIRRNPERYIFLIVIDIACFIFYIVLYLRYLEIKEFSKFCPSNSISQLINGFSLTVGILIVFGLKVFMNLPPDLLDVKYRITITTVVYTFIIVYSLMQTIISYRMIPYTVTTPLVFIRTLLVLLQICIAISIQMTRNVHTLLLKAFKSLHWEQKLDYVDFKINHDIIGEWVFVLSCCLFLTTYVREFRRIIFSWPKVYIRGVSVNFSGNKRMKF